MWQTLKILCTFWVNECWIWWAVNFLLNKNPSTLKGGPKLALARGHCAQVTPAGVHHIYWIVRPPKRKGTLCLTRGAGTQILMSLRRRWGGGLVYRQALRFVQVQNIDASCVGVGSVGSVPSSSPLSMPVNEYLFFLAVFAHLKEWERFCCSTSYHTEAKM